MELTAAGMTAAGAAVTLAELGITSSTIPVTVSAGMTSGTAEVEVSYDASMDDGNTTNEMFTITGMSGMVGGDATATPPVVNEVTITVMDDDTGNVASVGLSSGPLSVMEGEAITATVTVTVNLESGGVATTVDVALSSDLPTGSIATPVSVPIEAGMMSGSADVTLTYDAPQDTDTADKTFTITGMVGMVGGDATATPPVVNEVTLTVLDDDAGAVTSVGLSPTMLEVNEGEAITATVTLTVNVATRGAAATHSVDLTVAGAALTDLNLTSPVMVDVAKGDLSGTVDVEVSYDATMGDANTTNEMITITGMVGMVGGDATATPPVVNEVTLTVKDDDAGMVTGLNLEPDTPISVTEGVAFSGSVIVTLTVDPGAAATHDVTLSSSLPTGAINTPVSVPVLEGAPSSTVTVALAFTPEDDTDTLDETITLTGSIGTFSDVVTINVTDDDKRAIKISTDMESIRENSRTRSVVVTATLPAAPGAGNTVMVDVMVTGGTAPVSTTITISGTDLSGTATVDITPVNDEVFTTSAFTVTGSATGYVDGTAAIDILDDDASLGSLSVTSAPPSATLNGGAQDLTLTVKVTLASPDTPIPNPLVVNVTTSKGTLASSTVSITNTKKDANKDPAVTNAVGTATVVLSLAAGDVNAAGDITVTASANMYETGTRAISIRARGARDADGYRAIIAKPTGTNWAIAGNNQIFVNVIRSANVAYPWEDFGSIKVSVRDTAHGDFEFEQVTLSNFNREDDGSVTFIREASPSNADASKWLGNETIQFKIIARVRAHSAYSSQDRADNGQYLGAYAHVEFTSGLDTDEIETRDGETSVYPANPSLVGNAKVGDGRLIRIDNLAPDNTGVADIVITSGDEVGSAVKATVGDEIRVAVALSQTNLFRETGLRIQLQIVDGVGTVNGQNLSGAERNNPSKNVNFTTSQVIAAANDSLIHTYKVTEGFFKVTLTDFVEGVGPLNAKIDLNNARARVRAGIRDQAGNFKWSGWEPAPEKYFHIDSRSPSVSILYPSANPDSLYEHTHPMRFTGKVEDIEQGQNVDDHLNPLAIVVDEDLSKLEVFAVGADTLDITGQMPSDAINDSTAVYDTNTLSSPEERRGRR